ncbi:hypothetical protein NL676_014498 [Syzygium grande]|nr:hypothetical protein NL676_014498 [Syzygium grande]
MGPAISTSKGYGTCSDKVKCLTQSQLLYPEALAQVRDVRGKMVRDIINKVMAIWMQLMWKVVRPEDLKLGDPIYRYGLYGLCSHQGELSFTLLLH